MASMALTGQSRMPIRCLFFLLAISAGYSASNLLERTSNTACENVVCPGEFVQYECAVDSRSLNTLVWRVSGCLRLSLLNQQGETRPVERLCDDGLNIRANLRVLNASSFMSTLNVTGVQSNLSVQCLFDDGSQESLIGEDKLLMTVSAPADFRQVDNNSSITVMWDPVLEGCPSVYYNFTQSDSCGTCFLGPDNNMVTCNNGGMSECNVTILTVVCGVTVAVNKIVLSVTSPSTISNTTSPLMPNNSGNLTQGVIAGVVVAVVVLILLVVFAVVISVVCVVLYIRRKGRRKRPLFETLMKEMQPNEQGEDQPLPEESRVDQLSPSPAVPGEYHPAPVKLGGEQSLPVVQRENQPPSVEPVVDQQPPVVPEADKPPHVEPGVNLGEYHPAPVELGGDQSLPVEQRENQPPLVEPVVDQQPPVVDEPPHLELGVDQQPGLELKVDQPQPVMSGADMLPSVQPEVNCLPPPDLGLDETSPAECGVDQPLPAVPGADQPPPVAKEASGQLHVAAPNSDYSLGGDPDEADADDIPETLTSNQVNGSSEGNACESRPVGASGEEYEEVDDHSQRCNEIGGERHLPCDSEAASGEVTGNVSSGFDENQFTSPVEESLRDTMNNGSKVHERVAPSSPHTPEDAKEKDEHADVPSTGSGLQPTSSASLEPTSSHPFFANTVMLPLTSTQRSEPRLFIAPTPGDDRIPTQQETEGRSAGAIGGLKHSEAMDQELRQWLQQIDTKVDANQKKLEELLKDKDKQISELKQNMQALQSTCDELAKQQLKLQKTVKSLQSRNADFERILQERQQKVLTCQSQNADLKKRLQEQQETDEKLRSENVDLKRKVKELEQTITSLQSENDDLKSLIQGQQEIIKNLQSQDAALGEELEKQDQMKKEKQEEINRLEREKQDLRTQPNEERSSKSPQ